jgi:hypothetical protein
LATLYSISPPALRVGWRTAAKSMPLAWRCARLATTTTRDGGACFQAIQQQLRQQEVADMADPEGQLEAGGGEPLLPTQPGVVDQHMQRKPARVEGLHALAHAGQVAQVQRDELGPGGATAALGDLAQHRGRLAGISASQKDVEPLQRQFDGGDAPDAGVCAGDQGDAGVGGDR